MTIHIQQKGYADCGVACIAMAANVEYERVLGSVAPDVYFHGMYWGEVLHALKKITGQEWNFENTFTKREWPRTLFDIIIDRPAILFVERDFRYTDPLIKTHYIFVRPISDSDLAILHDPTKEKPIEFEIAKQTIIGSWKVISAIFQK